MNKITKNHKLILLIILVIALGIRIWNLGNNPPGLYKDEAANGYDAYSLLKTGKDLHGRFLPILINHHDGDFLEPMYTYLSILPVGLFGLNEFSTRFMAALFGTLVILTTFFLVKKIFNTNTALLATLILTFSPMNFHFSRVGMRAILLPFFIILGYYLFLRGQKNKKYLLLSALSFGSSLYTYSTIKVFLPLFILGLIIIYRKTLIKLLKQKETFRYALISTLIFIALALPILYINIFDKAPTRFLEISIFNYKNPTQLFIKNYFSYFSPKFLFLKSTDNLRYNAGNFGEILIIWAPFILIGIWYLIKNLKPHFLFLIFWLLIAPIPASLTDTPAHAMRAISMMPLSGILSALGLFLVIKKVLYFKKVSSCLVITAIALLIIINIGFYLYNYFVVYPVEAASSWQYGLREIFSYVNKNLNNYESAVVSPKIKRAYVFILFYGKVNPEIYHRDKSFGKYKICNKKEIKDCFDKKNRKNLYIVRSSELKNTITLKNVYYPNGELARYKVVR